MIPLARAVLGALLPAVTLAWTQFTSATLADVCAQVEAPLWPFAYSKGNISSAPFPQQEWELKGRTASNAQNMGAQCELRGSLTTCHWCRHGCDLLLANASELGNGSACPPYQIQGADWASLPANVPTVTDVPFAVGPAVRHRYDFPSAQRVCVFLSGDGCAASYQDFSDYSACALRCWDAGGDGVGAVRTTRGWQMPPQLAENPQGRVFTLAGNLATPLRARRGYRDGPADSALFSGPQGVALAGDGSIFATDTGNHVIRRIWNGGGGGNASTGLNLTAADASSAAASSPGPTAPFFVDTVAGEPRVAGYRDGAALSHARFSSPAGIALLEDCSGAFSRFYSVATPAATSLAATATAVPSAAVCPLILIVADAHNHRIRIIVVGAAGTSASGGRVFTLAGGGSVTPHDDDADAAGYADSNGAGGARFDTPMGVAVDASGNVFVADTRNHVIRWVTPDGAVRTLAGTVGRSPHELPGCPPPCLAGQPGYRDGSPLASSAFYFPYGIAIGPGVAPHSLLVVDGDRVRLIMRAGLDPFSQLMALNNNNISGGAAAAAGALNTSASSADIRALDTVLTLAGGLGAGAGDGHGVNSRYV